MNRAEKPRPLAVDSPIQAISSLESAPYECFFNDLDKTMKDKIKFFGLYYRP
jgi:hypothetical protein